MHDERRTADPPGSESRIRDWRAWMTAAAVLAGLAFPSVANAETPLVIPADGLVGYQPAKISPGAARKDLGRGLPKSARDEVRRAAVQAASATKPGQRVSSEAFAFESSAQARRVHSAWRKANKPRPIQLASGGALDVRKEKRSTLTTIVWRHEEKLGLLELRAKGGAREARETALSLARAADGPLRNPLPKTAWGRVWDQVGDDGVVSKEIALEAIEVAYGPVPGVKAPKGKPEPLIEGTPAIRAVVPYRDQLSSAQRQVVDRYIGLSEPLGDVPARREYGDPEFTPDGQLQEQAQSWVRTFEALLHHPLGIRIVAGWTTAEQPQPEIPRIADAVPVQIGRDLPCRIRMFRKVPGSYPDDYLDGILGHEVFHCFQFDLAPAAWGVAGGWVIEGTAEWASLMVRPLALAERGGLFIENYLQSQTQLQLRSNDAVGFWGHVHDLTRNLWTRIQPVLAAGGDVDAAMGAAMKGIENEFMTTWASSRFRSIPGNPVWGMISPPIEKPSFDQLKPGGLTTIKADQPVFAEPYSTANHTIKAPKKRPIVLVSIKGEARLSDALNYTTLSEAWFCTSPAGCEPPEGLSCTVPPLQPLDNGAHLGLASRTVPTSGIVWFYAPEDFCRGKPTGIGGEWSGDWTSAKFGDSGHFDMRLKQSGKKFSGTVNIQGSPCVTKGTVSGRLEGDKIKFSVIRAEHRITYQGTLHEAGMAGSWAKVAQGRCAADRGTWSATR